MAATLTSGFCVNTAKAHSVSGVIVKSLFIMCVCVSMYVGMQMSVYGRESLQKKVRGASPKIRDREIQSACLEFDAWVLNPSQSKVK